MFLCDGGFKLPGEAQKIDRIISAFCLLYCEQNPNNKVFDHPDDAFVLAFAMIMLNTDLHNPNLKQGKNPPRKMTLEGFMRNLKGAKQGGDFDRNLLVEMYLSIKNNEIKWKEDQKEEEKIVGDDVTESQRAKERGHYFRTCYQALREAELKSAQWDVGIPQRPIVLALFESCVIEMVTAFQTARQSSDERFVDQCIQGTVFARTGFSNLGRQKHAKVCAVALKLLESHRHLLGVKNRMEREKTLTRTVRIGMKRYNNVIYGSDLVQWMIEKKVVTNEAAAIELGKELRDSYGLDAIGGDFSFENNKNIFSFVRQEESRPITSTGYFDRFMTELQKSPNPEHFALNYKVLASKTPMQFGRTQSYMDSSELFISAQLSLVSLSSPKSNDSGSGN